MRKVYFLLVIILLASGSSCRARTKKPPLVLEDCKQVIEYHCPKSGSTSVLTIKYVTQSYNELITITKKANWHYEDVFVCKGQKVNFYNTSYKISKPTEPTKPTEPAILQHK